MSHLRDIVYFSFRRILWTATETRSEGVYPVIADSLCEDTENNEVSKTLGSIANALQHKNIRNQSNVHLIIY